MVWARKIQSIAQIGLEYATEPYDRDRYTALRALSAEMMAESSGVPAFLPPSPRLRRAEWLELFGKETGYATPKVDVRGAVFRGSEILLCKERSDGKWSLPGGWADVNDPPSMAVIREVREETGYDVRCTKLAAVLDRDLHYHEDQRPFHSYKLMFLCEMTGQGGTLDHDIEEARFFPVGNLPDLSKARTLPMHIELLWKHHTNPALPTEFD